MNIGIDIDNTITDIEEDLFEVANNYTKEIKENFKGVNLLKYEGNQNLAVFYSNIFGWNEEQTNYFFRNQRIKVIDEATPRINAREVINKLKDEGNNIYIITARTTKFDDIPYERAKKWLDKNGILYDKLVVNAIDKAIVSKELAINLFIDDQLNNCMNLSKNGINTIRLTDSKETYNDFVNISNWKAVYEYIQNLKR